jgi:hypothetical protein
MWERKNIPNTGDTLQSLCGNHRNIGGKGMKRVLIVALLFCFSFAQAYEITIYGRNTCGFTTNLRNELTASNIPFSYCNIDSAGCLGAMFSVAIEFNLAPTGTVNLPVVLVINEGKRFGYIRPTVNQIMKVTNISGIYNAIGLYPNPSAGTINVGGKSELYNTLGIRIMTTDSETIDIASLLKGVYIIIIDGKPFKLIKE